MDRKTALAGLAVALLVSAGAVGVYVLSDTPEQDPNEADEAAFPDGLSADGHTNGSELVATHEAALNNTSYVNTFSVRASYANGTPAANWSHDVEIGPRGDIYRHVQTANASVGHTLRFPDRVVTWSNSTVTVSQWHTDNTTFYRRSDFDRRYPRPGFGLQSVFAAVNTSFDGQTFGPPFTVHATTVVDASALRSHQTFENPRNVSFSATITETGVVESYRLEYTATFRNDRIHVVEQYELTARGIDVPKPDWVETAIRRTR